MLLHTKFEGRLISRCGDQNWPPRSCDLTPMDFFLWGYVKAHVYENKPRTIEELKEEIRRVIGELDPEMCQQVISNFVIRTKACQRSRGVHMPDMIFHT
ncbi:unnamed protein product [Macrosiphum euphorbiae]|uniref:Uncharacterized protein n=1 Tax=Macrosiphum euphorbiae TaxID=13131 RepID=A0AAV0XEP6_9HEMI|nr:unnamed protein product [Macrosiphum euphorbiae]